MIMLNNTTVTNKDNVKRALRKRRKSNAACPICQKNIVCGEEMQHYHSEIECLNRDSRKLFGSFPMDLHSVKVKAKLSAGLKERHQKFLELRANRDRRRQAFVQLCSRRRQASESRRRHTSETGSSSAAEEDEASCPVCLQTIYGTPDLIATHVDRCVRRQRRQSGVDDVDLDVDVEDSDQEAIESYVWAGQARLRASSLLPLDAFPERVQASTVDQTLDVDGQTFGSPQYTEADLPCYQPESPSATDEGSRIREIMIGEGDSAHGQPVTSDSGADHRDDFEALSTHESSSPADVSADFKCVVCMGAYSRPVVSVVCWHVCCESCWLHTLGAKKLCPKCKAITTPMDLKRLYM